MEKFVTKRNKKHLFGTRIARVGLGIGSILIVAAIIGGAAMGVEVLDNNSMENIYSSATAVGIGAVGSPAKMNKETKKREPDYTSTGGVAGKSEVAGSGKARKLVRGWRMNMSAVGAHSTREGFPFVTPVDLLGHSANELAVSGSFQVQTAKLLAGHTGTQKWAEYRIEANDLQQVMTRRWNGRKFSSVGMGQRALYNGTAASGQASAYSPKLDLQAQMDYLNEWSFQAGIHLGELYADIELSRLYLAHEMKGPAGLTALHQAGETPYQRMYNEALAKYDAAALGIPIGQRLHYTLEDMAVRSMSLLFPRQGDDNTGHTFVVSPHILLNARKVLEGMAVMGRGYTTDSDGNPRLLVPIYDVSANAGIDLVDDDDAVVLSSITQDFSPERSNLAASVAGRRPPQGAITDLYLNSTAGGEALPTLGGATFQASTQSPHHELQHYSLRVSTPKLHPVWPLGGDPYAVVDADITAALGQTGFHKAPWSLNTVELKSWLRWMTSQLDVQFQQFFPDEERLRAMVYEPQQSTLPWNVIVDLENIYKAWSMQFNPVKDGVWNNGPFADNIDIGEVAAYWRAGGGIEAEDEATKDELADSAFNRVVVPCATGTGTVLLADTAKSLCRRQFDSVVGYSASLVSKKERNVVIPVGRASSENVLLSGDQDTNVASFVALLCKLSDGHRWLTGGYTPLSDVSYLGTGVPEDTLGRLSFRRDHGGVIAAPTPTANASGGNTWPFSAFVAEDMLKATDAQTARFVEDQLDMPGLEHTIQLTTDEAGVVTAKASASTYAEITGGVGHMYETGAPLPCFASALKYKPEGSTGQGKLTMRPQTLQHYIPAEPAHGGRNARGETAVFEPPFGVPVSVTRTNWARLKDGTVRKARNFDTLANSVSLDKLMDELQVSPAQEIHLDEWTMTEGGASFSFFAAIGQDTVLSNHLETVETMAHSLANGMLTSIVRANANGATITVGPLNAADTSTWLTAKAVAPFTALSVVQVYGNANKGTRVLPELVNLAYSPWTDFFDASVYYQSGLFVNPRKENTDLEGSWPLHGEGRGFARDFVDPDLYKVDTLAVSPFVSDNIDRLRVRKVVYDPLSYQDIAFKILMMYGANEFGSLTEDRITQAQSGMHLTRIGN